VAQATDDLLRANVAFYVAFGAGDLEALDALWAEGREVAVLHPGWPAIFGREAVMESWRRILQGPHSPEVACGDARAFLQGETGFVICIEHLGDGLLVATNIFVREGGQWRLVHHQAGPAASGSLEGEPVAVH